MGAGTTCWVPRYYEVVIVSLARTNASEPSAQVSQLQDLGRKEEAEGIPRRREQGDNKDKNEEEELFVKVHIGILL